MPQLDDECATEARLRGSGATEAFLFISVAWASLLRRDLVSAATACDWRFGGEPGALTVTARAGALGEGMGAGEGKSLERLERFVVDAARAIDDRVLFLSPKADGEVVLLRRPRGVRSCKFGSCGACAWVVLALAWVCVSACNMHRMST